MIPPTSDPESDRRGQNVLIINNRSFALDDDWTRAKTDAAPISGKWAFTNGALVLRVEHTESCKMPEGTELTLKVLELTADSLRVLAGDSQEEMVLKRTPE